MDLNRHPGGLSIYGNFVPPLGGHIISRDSNRHALRTLANTGDGWPYLSDPRGVDLAGDIILAKGCTAIGLYARDFSKP